MKYKCKSAFFYHILLGANGRSAATWSAFQLRLGQTGSESHAETVYTNNHAMQIGTKHDKILRN